MPELDRRVCLEEAQRRFSPEAMATAYEAVYRELISRRAPASKVAKAGV